MVDRTEKHRLERLVVMALMATTACRGGDHDLCPGVRLVAGVQGGDSFEAACGCPCHRGGTVNV